MKSLSWLLIIFSSVVWANPLDKLTLRGEATMQYLFWDLYHAKFYSEQNVLTPPMALELTYLREISSAQLVEATRDEWQKQGRKSAQHQKWLKQLATLWPDVKEGDSLLLYVEASGASHFYFNQQQLGDMADSEFGEEFLAIWLGEQTSEPGLRSQLLGGVK
ncbi:chalcone isomerase family protein [Pseudoalteromonas fenneropenaei]|uniref:Chalcone isomerase family protein n=1 Tax=Pseudoalteromonas fenneropenaei TaxID=1737459 RepID=A0ABV7CHB1_9GAMM